jgi:RHS repeat-associated protein
VTWRERYLSYGTRVRREDGGSNSLWYTGKSEESDFGLQYFGARWYDSQLGQFLAIDPVGYREQKTTSFNRYSYAVQNPYKYVDPDGKLEIWAQKNMVDGTYTYSVRLAKPVDKWQPVINIFGPWQYGVGDAISETVKGKPAGPKEGIDIERVIALDAKLGNYIESSENGLFEYSETEIDDAIQRFMTDGHNGDSGVSQKDVSEFFKIYGGDGTNLMKKARENYDNSGKNVHIPSVVAPALER